MKTTNKKLGEKNFFTEKETNLDSEAIENLRQSGLKVKDFFKRYGVKGGNKK